MGTQPPLRWDDLSSTPPGGSAPLRWDDLSASPPKPTERGWFEGLTETSNEVGSGKGGLGGWLERGGIGAFNSLARMGVGLSRVAEGAARSAGFEDTADNLGEYLAGKDRALERRVLGVNPRGVAVEQSEGTAETLGNLGRFVGTDPLGFGAYAGEKIVGSVPDMVASVYGLPVYAASLTGRGGQTRSENNAADGLTFGDVLKAAPTSIAQGLIERYATRGLGGGGIARGAAREAGTEFGQEVLDYAGGTVGTERGFDPDIAAGRGIQGAAIGAPFGAVAGAAGNLRGRDSAVADAEPVDLWEGSLDDLMWDDLPEGPPSQPRDLLSLPAPEPIAGLLPAPPPRQLPSPPVYVAPDSAAGVGSEGLADLDRTAPARRVDAGRPEPVPIDAFMQRVRGAESAGDDAARNPRSSATGRYQFTNQTWLATYKRRFGDQGLTDAQILAKRRSGALQDQLMRDLTEANATALQRAGIPATEGNLYLAHFAGEAGARKLHRADPDASVERVLGKGVVNANPFLKGRTAADVIAWADRKMGGTTSAIETEALPDIDIPMPDQSRQTAAIESTPSAAPEVSDQDFRSEAARDWQQRSDAPDAPSVSELQIARSTERPRPNRPDDMVRFVARNGGLSYDGLGAGAREAGSRGHDLRNTGNLAKFVPGAGPLLRPGGKSLDEMGERLWEAGYFGPPDITPRPTDRQVIDRLDQVIRTGEKVYAEGGAGPAPRVPRLDEHGRTEAQALADDRRHALTARWDDATQRLAMSPLTPREMDAVADLARQGTDLLPAIDPMETQSGGQLAPYVLEWVNREIDTALDDAWLEAETAFDEHYEALFGPDARRESDAGRAVGARQAPVAGDAGASRPLGEARESDTEGIGALTERPPSLDLGEGTDPNIAAVQRQQTNLRATAPMRGRSEQEGTMGSPLFDAADQPGLRFEGDAPRESRSELRGRGAGEGVPSRIAAVQAALDTRLEALGLSDKARLEVVESLASGAQGEFHPLERLIKVALDARQDGSEVLDHEALHALRELGVFSAADWSKLVTAAKKRPNLWRRIERDYADIDQDGREEEAVADLFSMWRAGKVEPGTAIRSLLERLRDFLGALRSTLRGEGFRTWQDVLREIESGTAATRTGQHPETRHAQFARRIGSTFGAGYSRKTSAQRSDDSSSNVRYSRPEAGAERRPASEDDGDGLAERLVDSDGLKRDADAVRQAIGDPLNTLRKVVRSGLADNLRAYWYSADSRLRTLAERFGSRAIHNLADQFHARAGIADAFTGKEFGATGETYHEAVQREGHGRANRALQILAAFSKNEAALERIANLLRQPDARHRATRAEANAAAKLATLLKDTIDYRRKAGEDIGEITTGYFPRIMDAEKVLANKGAFLHKAEQLYRGIDAPNPRASAEGWLNHIFETYAGLDGGLAMANLLHDARPAGAGRSTAKERKFGADADRLMAEYYFSDPAAALVTYFTGAAKKAEEARRFGGDKLETMLDRIRRDIARSGEDPGDAMETIANLVATQLGRVDIPGQRMRSTVGVLHAIGMLGTLDRVTITSLSEAMMGFVRGGPRYGIPMLTKSAREFARELKGADPSDARRWAEALGVATQAMFADAMMARAGIDRATASAGSTKVLQNFFRAVGLQQWTEASRSAALDTGRELLAQLAGDMDSRNGRVRRNAAAYLTELGVSDPETFADWLNEGGLPTLDNLLRHDASPNEQAYRTALMRYASQVIMKPGRSEKPRWSNHPVGSLLFSLMSFSYGFKKNVLDRTARLGARALRQKDPTLLYPAFGLAGLLAVHTAINSVLRPLVFGGGREDDEEGVTYVDLVEAADRAGLTGAASPLVNAVWGVRYNRSLTESLAGPVVGRPLDAATKVVNLGTSRNSANTNSAERAAAEALYDVALEPAVEAFGLTRLRGPARVASVWGTGTREGGVLPSDRAWFVDAVAGEERPK